MNFFYILAIDYLRFPMIHHLNDDDSDIDIIHHHLQQIQDGVTEISAYDGWMIFFTAISCLGALIAAGVAWKATKIAKESAESAKESTELAKQSLTIAKESAETTKESHTLTKQSLTIAKEAMEKEDKRVKEHKINTKLNIAHKEIFNYSTILSEMHSYYTSIVIQVKKEQPHQSTINNSKEQLLGLVDSLTRTHILLSTPLQRLGEDIPAMNICLADYNRQSSSLALKIHTLDEEMTKNTSPEEVKRYIINIDYAFRELSLLASYIASNDEEGANKHLERCIFIERIKGVYFFKKIEVDIRGEVLAKASAMIKEVHDKFREVKANSAKK